LSIERQRGRDSVGRSAQEPERVTQSRRAMQRQSGAVQYFREASVVDVEG